MSGKVFRLIVAGSRGFKNYDYLKNRLDYYLSETEGEIEIVSGTARGADQLGERYAAERGLLIKRMPADWERHGLRAGYLRNEEMAKYAAPDGGCICFWDGKSSGTGHMIDLAKKYNLKLRVIKF